MKNWPAKLAGNLQNGKTRKTNLKARSKIHSESHRQEKVRAVVQSLRKDKDDKCDGKYCDG